MRSIKFISLSIILLIVFQTHGQKTFYKNITIKSYKYLQNYEHFKRLCLDSDDGNAEYIDGFNFEWGYEYNLKVKVTELSETLSDGTRYDYALDKVINKTKMPDSTEFTLHIDPLLYYYMDEEMGDQNYTLKELSPGLYLFCEEVEIEVPEQLIEAFEKLRKSENGRRGHFEFVNEQRIRLVRF